MTFLTISPGCRITLFLAITLTHSLKIDTLPPSFTPGEQFIVTWHRDTNGPQPDPPNWNFEFVQDQSPIGGTISVPSSRQLDATMVLTIPTSPEQSHLLQLVAINADRGTSFTNLAELTVVPANVVTQSNPHPSQTTEGTSQTSSSFSPSAMTGTPTARTTLDNSLAPQTSAAASTSTTQEFHSPSKSTAMTTLDNSLAPQTSAAASTSTTQEIYSPSESTAIQATSPPLSSDGGSGTQGARPAIIVPSVLGTFFIFLVLIVLLWRYRRKQRSTHVFSSDNVEDHPGSDSHPPPSGTIYTYNLKPKFTTINPLDIEESFLGERESTTLSSPYSASSTTLLGRLFPWNRAANDSEHLRPYDPRSLATVNRSLDEHISTTESRHISNSRHSSLISPALPPTRPRSSSEFSIRRSSTPPESTSRQIQLQVEADELRTRVSALERDAVLSDEVRRMRDHIQRLEMLVTSNWAMGLTNEPPPTYHA
ncbi:hypothetical protein D9758_004975 [Tetrapyrgos nigripes]|uniref:Uncharacterized protein n=1 Tax=Tetrapyrgos nigripes TaxID=182062 RepID=A0A8H5LWR9_9AGAR|nr:hypothetical protein D9758_004975 [Tetrapyrgos nigripes]